MGTGKEGTKRDEWLNIVYCGEIWSIKYQQRMALAKHPWPRASPVAQEEIPNHQLSILNCRLPTLNRPLPTLNCQFSVRNHQLPGLRLVLTVGEEDQFFFLATRVICRRPPHMNQHTPRPRCRRGRTLLPGSSRHSFNLFISYCMVDQRLLLGCPLLIKHGTGK